ncbi:MAG: TrmB family transcriptional regulator [Saccharofermentanales bacterium]
MAEIYEVLQDVGFSINEAKVYVALISKNPISGYEVAKRSNITRTMVYDILNRLVQKGAVLTIENEPKLYTPLPYKELFKKFRDDYNNRIEAVETALDTLECEENTSNYIKNISDYESMVQEVRTLIQSARREIYISIWEEEAILFKDDFEKAIERGVAITAFSFNKIPYNISNSHTYGIPSDELKKIWSRRRIIVVVDRERILIGEGNDQIEEISIITSNTMLIELAIDQMLLDIIHLHELRKGGYLPHEITNVRQYTDAVASFQEDLGIDMYRVFKRVDQD